MKKEDNTILPTKEEIRILKQKSSPIKVCMNNEQVFINPDKKCVAVKKDAVLQYNLPQRVFGWDLWNLGNQTGIAKCSDEDQYSEKKGYIIAEARAENECYKKAIKALNDIEKESAKLADAAKAKADLLKIYINRNESFIKTVGDED